jgi:glycosyltransferase involved in cell wall biosynthesis
VTVITARVDPTTAELEVLDGVQVHRIPALRLPKTAISLNFPWLNATFWPRNLRRIERIVRENGVQVLHVHNHMFDLALAASWLKRKLRLPIVLTIHTMIKHPNPLYNAVLYPIDRFFLKRAAINAADVVICPDVNMRAYVESRFRRSGTRMIPYGIGLPQSGTGDKIDEIRARYRLQGRRVIVSLGHVHALRNRLDLIRALSVVRERFSNVLLLVVGDVADQRPVRLVKELGLQDHVVFTGAQPYADVPAYHAVAELEAMWFDQAEGGLNPLGIACMEAMYSGRPVITVSNENTFGPGVLENGRNVILVRASQTAEIARAISDLLASEEKTRAIGDAARETARRHFDWQAVTSSTAGIYEGLIDRESGRPEQAASSLAGISA